MGEGLFSTRGPEPVGPYPHARRAGPFLFLSGMGPRQRGQSDIPGVERDATGRVVRYDFDAQCRAVFENVRVILEDCGSSLRDVVDVSVFLTHMNPDFPVMNRYFAEYLSGPGKANPTRTTVEVTALPTDIAIELKVIALVGG